MVVAGGLLWNPIPTPDQPWRPDPPTQGLWLTGSDAEIYRQGYLPENLEAMNQVLTHQFMSKLIESSANLMAKSDHAEWANEIWEQWSTQPKEMESRIATWLKILALPDLGPLI